MSTLVSTLVSAPVAERGHRDHVLDAFTEAIWHALAAQLSLPTLPPSVYLEIDREVRAQASGRVQAAEDPGSGSRLVRFAGRGGFDRFQVELAGAIVCRLQEQGRLGRVKNLDLIARILPQALAGTLVRDLPAEGSDPRDDYRLARPPAGG